MSKPVSPESLGAWPRAVQLFVGAYLASTAFSGVNSFLQMGALRQRLIEVTQASTAPGDDWVYAFIAVRTAISLALLIWAIRRHSLIARLLIGLQFAGWMYGLPRALGFLAKGNYTAVPFTIAALFSLVAVACLLSAPSRQWFSRKGSTHADDVDRFS
ncbi:MAG: hypothetical protein ACKOQM_02940 [Novosphingobium sp.]